MCFLEGIFGLGGIPRNYSDWLMQSNLMHLSTGAPGRHDETYRVAQHKEQTS